MAALAVIREPLPVIHVTLTEFTSANIQDLRDILIDPITLEPMDNPVIDPCGHTFSRVSIETCLRNTPQCPLTRQHLTQEQLRTNLVVRDALDILNRPDRIELNLLACINTLNDHEIDRLEAGLSLIQTRRAADRAAGVPDRLEPGDPIRSVIQTAIELARKSTASMKECTAQTCRWRSA